MTQAHESELRVVCGGYVDVPYESVDQVASIMSKIASLEYERPEIEIIRNDGGLVVHLGAVWRQGRGRRPLGWVVLSELNGKSWIVCDSTTPDAPVEELTYCGAPIAVVRAAVLEAGAVLSLLPMLLSGATLEGYVRRDSREALPRQRRQ